MNTDKLAQATALSFEIDRLHARIDRLISDRSKKGNVLIFAEETGRHNLYIYAELTIPAELLYDFVDEYIETLTDSLYILEKEFKDM